MFIGRPLTEYLIDKYNFVNNINSCVKSMKYHYRRLLVVRSGKSVQRIKADLFKIEKNSQVHDEVTSTPVHYIHLLSYCFEGKKTEI